MKNDLLPTLIAFGVSLGFGWIFIPAILNFCKERHLYDIPNQRKVHRVLVPRLGGIAFVPAMALAMVVSVAVMSIGLHEGKVEMSLWSVAFLASLLLMYAVGVVDDFIGLDAPVKFLVQTVTACTLPLCGLYINHLYGFLGIYELPYWVGMPLTVFVIVFIDNALNLIDGIDGLAASLSIIALAGFFCIFTVEGLTVYGILIASLVGVLIAYLYFNIWGKAEKNRKIFMGDAGSLTLGFILGFLFVKATMDNRPLMTGSAARWVLAYSLLVVPVFDVARIILHRLRFGQPLFQADKNHIHHKLMRAGCSQHQALIVILGLQLGVVFLNLSLFRHIGITWVVLIDVVLFTALQTALTRRLTNRKTAEAE